MHNVVVSPFRVDLSRFYRTPTDDAARDECRDETSENASGTRDERRSHENRLDSDEDDAYSNCPGEDGTGFETESKIPNTPAGGGAEIVAAERAAKSLRERLKSQATKSEEVETFN